MISPHSSLGSRGRCHLAEEDKEEQGWEPEEGKADLHDPCNEDLGDEESRGLGHSKAKYCDEAGWIFQDGLVLVLWGLG